MKCTITMDLDDVLRIAQLLDHHAHECAGIQGATAEEPLVTLFSSWGMEAQNLRSKLLKAVGKAT